MSNVIQFPSTNQQARKGTGADTGNAGHFAATSRSRSSVGLAAPVEQAGSRQRGYVIPDSLLMAQEETEDQIYRLGSCVSESLELDSSEPSGRSYRAEYAEDRFVEELGNLPPKEAKEYLRTAKSLHASHRDAELQECLTQARDANLAAHPGGALSGAYRPADYVGVDGGYGPNAHRGEKYGQTYDVAVIARHTREEIKAAKAAGYLPAGLDYRVNTQKYAGGQSMNITVLGISDEDRQHPHDVDFFGDPENLPEVRELSDRLERIGAAWNHSDSDSMTDYFNETYYTFVRIEDDRGRQYREQDAAERKAKRAARG